MILGFLDTIETENRKIVYSELYEILRNIEKDKVMQIPSYIIKEIIYGRDKEYKVIINWNKPLTEQKFNEDTINVLGWINSKFWKQNEKEELSLIVKKESILNKIKRLIESKKQNY